MPPSSDPAPTGAADDPRPSRRDALARTSLGQFLARLIREHSFLQGVVLLLAVAVAVLATALATVASQSQIKPYVLVADQLGAIRPLAPLGALDPLEDEPALAYFIRDWLLRTRTILADAEAQRALILHSLDFTDGVARTVLQQYYDSQEYRQLVRTSSRTLELTSLLPIDRAAGVWSLRWHETLHPRGSNAEPEPTAWEAVLTIESRDVSNQHNYLTNPFGLAITSLAWAASKSSP